MKKIAFFFILVSVVFFSKFVKIDFLSLISAQEDIEEENKNQKDQNIKTELDQLKYDYTDEEIEGFLQQYERIIEIRKRKIEIEDEIAKLKNDIDENNNNVQRLKRLYSNLDNKFDNSLKADEKNIMRLVKTYESMKPSEVSRLLIGHKTSIVLALLKEIKPAKAGKIFNEMIKIDKGKVVKLAERYSGFDSKYTKDLREKKFNEEDPSND
jgi:flagellar motility protein MotE (MotC chaperone)